MPPTVLRGRQPRTTYLYDDPNHPGRVTSTFTDSMWTPDDRALLLALEAHEATLCPGCGHPKAVAWHDGLQASWKNDDVVCHACTERKGSQVAYGQVHTSATTGEIAALPPFSWGKTTTPPDPPSQR